MICPDCGKKLPENAAKCNKCGYVFREIKKNSDTDDYLKKEKEKAAKKAEKKSKKKPVDRKKILKIVIPIAAVVLAASTVFGIVSHISKKKEQARIEEIRKNTPELLIEYTFKEVSKEDAVLSIGDVNIGEAEYEFFYRQSFSKIQNEAQRLFREYVAGKLGDKFSESTNYYNDYYDEYAEGKQNLFDYTRPITAQTGIAVDENGNEISWQEYIRNDAINDIMKYRVRYALAQKAGMKLTDDIRIQVYQHIEGLRDAISGSGYQNLEQYLQVLFGPSCDEEFFKNELIREKTAEKYDSVYAVKKLNSYKDSDIKKAYESKRADYDYIDLYYYEVSGKDAEKTAKKISGASSTAEEFSAAIKKYTKKKADKESLPVVSKQRIGETFSDKMAEWAYSTDRKAGDCKAFKTSGGYTVAFIQAPAYSLSDCVSYREIIFGKNDANGTPLDSDSLKKAKENAQKIYDEWQNNENKTEDTFSYYAIAKSEGSTASAGGLVSYVPAKDLSADLGKWVSDKSRKAGDVQLIETDTGYCVIYFIRNYGQSWNYTIRAEKALEASSQNIRKANEGKYAPSLKEEKLSDKELIIISKINEQVFGIAQ